MGLLVDQNLDVDYYANYQSEYNTATVVETTSVDSRAFTNNYSFGGVFEGTKSDPLNVSDVERLGKMVGLESSVKEPTQTMKAMQIKETPNYGLFIAIGLIGIGVLVWALA